MAAPGKVRAMAEEANRLIAERSTGTIPTGSPTTPTVEAPTLSVVTDQPTAVIPSSAENPYAVDPALLTPPAPAPRPMAAVPVAEAPADGWQHKYSVLQGMMKRSQEENTDKISQLENQIEVLTVMARPTPSIQDTFHPEAAVPTDYGMTEEEIDALGGQDFVDSILKISAAGTATEMASLRQEISTLKNDQSESEESAFYSQLTGLSPNWRAINKSDSFQEWLEGDEGLSGIAKKNFLSNAYETQDANMAANYFNAFQALLPGSPDLNPIVTGEIIPDTGGGGGPAVPTVGGVIYSRASIKQFFKDKGLGKFKGREAEAQAIEQDIFAAQSEGRIITRNIPAM